MFLYSTSTNWIFVYLAISNKFLNINMAANKIRLTFDFTEEQLETTKTFFNYNDWDFEESKVSDTKTVSSGNCDVSTQTENTEPGPQTPCESQDDRPPPEFHIDQDLSKEECP